MNERVKQIRLALGLSGEKFGQALGVQRNAISRIETGKNGLSEQMLLAICREYGVNETWLRTGEGEMFVPMDDLSLDELASREGLDPFEKELLKAYFSLDKDVRKKALEHFKKTLGNLPPE